MVLDDVGGNGTECLHPLFVWDDVGGIFFFLLNMTEISYHPFMRMQFYFFIFFI